MVEADTATTRTAEEVLAKLRDEIVRLGTKAGLMLCPIERGTSLVNDVGLDSLLFVDLTLAIERAFGIDRFPMQDWADSEEMRPMQRHTVGSLVDHIVSVLPKSPP